MTTHSEKILEQMKEQNRKAYEIGMLCLKYGVTKADIFEIVSKKSENKD